MTLDDAIIYYDGIAKEYRANTDIKRNDYMDLRNGTFEAEQLASWLNELKLLRERIEKYPKPYEDCISRRDAIKKFTYNSKGKRIPDYDWENWPVQIDIKTVKEILRDLPSATLWPKMGRWIPLGNYDDYGNESSYKCSECGDLDTYPDNFCPNCGAKMQEAEEK